ncbi:unnamed protein product [Dicrocoelium dendriticum]|nr:unnamed protein product [Dicrocoelium dendriticum]
MTLFSVLCFGIQLLGISSEYLSIMISEDEAPYEDFVNHTLHEKISLYCNNKLSYLNPISTTACIVDNWSYDPRRMLLTCVCLVRSLTQIDGRLLRIGPKYLAIPAIAPSEFASNYEIRRGTFEYAILVRTKSNAVDYLSEMLSTRKSNDAQLTGVTCKPSAQQTEHICRAAYKYSDEVSWDYPEYWIGPVENLIKLYDRVYRKNVEFIGMSWPEVLEGNANHIYADIVRLITRDNSDICGTYLQYLADAELKTKTKCRVEFTEQDETARLLRLARLNLFAPVETDVNASLEVEAFKLANRLKYPGISCDTPVQIRKSVPSYVPTYTVPSGKGFEFIVTYVNTKEPRSNLNVSRMPFECDKLKQHAHGMIDDCYGLELKADYATIRVLTHPKPQSVWKSQQELMFMLNSRNREKCDFNVENTVFPKYPGI